MKTSRLERILIVVIGILVLAFLGLLVFLLVIAAPANVAEATPSPAPETATLVPQFTPAPSETSALSLYPQALIQAKQWRADAQLVSCRATWETTAVNLVGRPTTWYFRFYSEETKSLYFVTITPDGQINGVQHLRRLSQPPPLLAVSEWSVDSQAALTNWMNAGGGQFLGSRPGSDITAQLGVRSNGTQPAWTVVGYDRANDTYFAVDVAATDGVTTAIE